MGDDPTKRNVENIQNASIASIKRAFEENVNEVNFFIHAHLRHYDEKGEGKKQDGRFVDQYGAPIPFHDTWMDGFKAIENALLDHNGACQNKYTYFPLLGGYSGGTHLYKIYNKEKPWNWTGWIPQQNTFPYNSDDGHVMYYNRFFIALRGNEIQNDMWDHDPRSIDVDTDVKGKYRGGYWFQGDVRAQYLHIMSLKTCLRHDRSRYNYILHPLAYRSSLDTTYPDVVVDGIQWSVNNIMKETYIKMKEWGGKVNGIELFNDYTFYYTWIGNGKKKNGSSNGEYIEWFDTYPLEYCEFILDTALSNGVYLQALSANDVFYNRTISHIDNDETDNEDTRPAVNKNGQLYPKPEEMEDMDPHERMLQRQILLSDPKGKYAVLKLKNESTESNIDITESESMWPKRWQYRQSAVDIELKKSNKFMKARPYGHDTVFGYTTLLDTEGKLKNSVFPETPGFSSGIEINKGELYILDMLQKGQFYSHTGIYGIFNYEDYRTNIPICVQGQKNPMEMWYNEMEKDFNLVFQFPPERKKKSFPSTEEIPPWVGKLIWRYTIEYVDKEKKERVLTTGYFKLSENTSTELNLQYYTKYKVKWIRFTAFYADNPMQRAWFSPIKGQYFNKKIDDYPNLRNRIAIPMKHREQDQNSPLQIEDYGDEFAPTEVDTNSLEFTLGEADEENLHCYYLQVNARIVRNAPNTPRYLENVHGYFPVHQKYPTMLVLSNSWDSTTVKDKKVFFYKVNGKTCEPEHMGVHA